MIPFLRINFLIPRKSMCISITRMLLCERKGVYQGGGRPNPNASCVQSQALVPPGRRMSPIGNWGVQPLERDGTCIPGLIGWTSMFNGTTNWGFLFCQRRSVQWAGNSTNMFHFSSQKKALQ